MPAWITPLLRDVVSRAYDSWRSSTTTECVRASSAAIASPTAPAPMTTTSASGAASYVIPLDRRRDLAARRDHHIVVLATLDGRARCNERSLQTHASKVRSLADDHVRPDHAVGQLHIRAE